MMKKILTFMTAAALTLSLASGVMAATKKSTKKAPAKKSAVMKATAQKEVAEGVNVNGRTGLIWAETAQASAKGDFGGSIHLLFMTASESVEFMGTDYDYSTTNIVVPFGVRYGAARNLEIGATLDFLSSTVSVEDESETTSGLNDLNLGVKYVIEGKDAPVDFGVGADIVIGPMSDDFGDSATDFAPRGMVTYEKNGLLLNGMLGFVITGTEGLDDFIQLGAGAGLALSPKLTGIAELGVNTFNDEAGVLAVGVRTNSKTQLQATLGLGLGDAAPDFVLGGGVCF
jgi:hypothetical protein